VPFTPLHFGPGLLCKALLGRHLSLLAFVLAQVVIDVETAWWMLRGEWVIHRFLHTYAGSTLAAGVVVLLAWRLPLFATGAWNRRVAREGLPGWGLAPRPERAALVAGALLGAWSHVLLDSLMHADMDPLAPWSQGNGLLGALSLAWLNAFCVGSGLLGLGLLVLHERRRGTGAPADG